MSILLIQWLGTTGYTDTDRDTSTEYQQADAAAALYLQLWKAGQLQLLQLQLA